MSTPDGARRQGNALVFFLSAWLTCALVSAIAVTFLVRTVNATAKQGDPSTTQNPAAATSPGPDGQPRSAPTGGSSGSSPGVGAAGPRNTTTSAPSPDNRPSSNRPSPTVEVPPSSAPLDKVYPGVHWIIVLRSYEKSEYTYDEAVAQAAVDIDRGGYTVIDTDDHPGWLTGAHWSAVYDGDYPTRGAAQDDCHLFGEKAGRDCYGQHLPND